MADKPEKAKCALNNSKIALSAPCPGMGPNAKHATLKFEIFQNNPRIVVRSNDPSEANRDKNFGEIKAAMDPTVFYAFLEFLKIATDSPTEIKNKIENWNHDFIDGQRSENPVHVSDTWVGKDKDGCVFISVISTKENRHAIKFITVDADKRWHKFIHSDGRQYTMAEASVIKARAWYNLLSNLVGNLLVSTYVEPPPYIPGGGAGSNYRNRSNSNNSNNNNISDGDLPF